MPKVEDATLAELVLECVDKRLAAESVDSDEYLEWSVGYLSDKGYSGCTDDEVEAMVARYAEADTIAHSALVDFVYSNQEAFEQVLRITALRMGEEI